jgi:hypothetical protein
MVTSEIISDAALLFYFRKLCICKLSDRIEKVCQVKSTLGVFYSLKWLVAVGGD